MNEVATLRVYTLSPRLPATVDPLGVRFIAEEGGKISYKEYFEIRARKGRYTSFIQRQT